MLKVDKVHVCGFEAAIRGMRNPLESWLKGDSYGEVIFPNIGKTDYNYVIGSDDMKLCKALIKSGSSDRKFLRMIHAQIDITAPLYWWKEMDQYKVGTTTDSCSTMHKIHSRDLTIEDFSTEHLTLDIELFNQIIEELNKNRKLFIETRDKQYWWNMIQLLPSSFNQMRTWDGDYETLLGMYFSRRNHKLDEWHTLCDEILKLPYMKDFIEVLDKKESSN